MIEKLHQSFFVVFSQKKSTALSPRHAHEASQSHAIRPKSPNGYSPFTGQLPESNSLGIKLSHYFSCSFLHPQA